MLFDGIVEQILQLPQMYTLLPSLVFIAVVGVIYWLTRPAAQLIGDALYDAISRTT